MKPVSLYGVLALVLAACAPQAPVAGPAPAAPPARAEPGPPPVREPDAALALATAPEAWWLLDEGTDRVRGIGAARAYRELLAGRRPAQEVVVAILDSGIDIEHEDLDDVLWVNADEVAGNNVDDDRNGYVDDVHGWNFIGGPDGRQVEQDTYEVTRLYAALRPRYEGARRDTLSAAARAEYDRFVALREEWQEARTEAMEQLQQTRRINTVVQQVATLLRQELRTDSLTVEKVTGLRTVRPDVQQARGIYLEIAAQGFTPEMIQEQVEALQSRVEHGLNPEFDPRPIVGDNYADPRERIYGNALVEGPDAEHGTHVAGIVAAERGNGIGIDGIAPSARIMVLRVVPDGDERDKDVANAIRYAVDNGAKIINMSFGKGHSPQKSVVDEAVRYAEERGVLLVHAAGNDASDIGEKPSYPTRQLTGGRMAGNWIEVGASAWQGPGRLAAPFSNFGRPEVDVFAPGVDIYSTVPGDRYKPNSGTSMAAPVVSGLAALIWAYYPQLTADEVRQIILDSATRYEMERVRRPGAEDEGDTVPFGELSATGAVVNAYEALRLAEQRSRR